MSASLSVAGGTSSGQVRLVGGRADPEGCWEYGRVQVFQGSDYVGVANGVSFAFVSSVTFGRREAQVACRSLGYGSGAVLLSGALSGLPGNDSTLYDTAAITCSGLETSLSDCTTESRASFFSDYESRSATASPVALLCTTSSGVFLRGGGGGGLGGGWGVDGEGDSWCG